MSDARQRTLPNVDTAPRRQGRAERGPTARKRWREFRTLTAQLVRGGDLEPSGWRIWHNFCDLGRLRRWWTATDVETLLRPYVLQGQAVPMIRTLRRAPPVAEPAAHVRCGCDTCRMVAE